MDLTITSELPQISTSAKFVNFAVVVGVDLTITSELPQVSTSAKFVNFAVVVGILIDLPF